MTSKAILVAARFTLIVAVVLGLSWLSVAMWNETGEKDQPAAEIQYHNGMTVAEFGQANGLERRALKELLAQGHSRLVLDISQMSFISSAGLRVIVYADREASGRGGQVRICGLNLQVRRVFEMAALDECLQLCDGCQEALEGW